MRLRKFFLISLSIIGIITYFITGVNRLPVEKIAVASAIGYDVEGKVGGVTIHSVPITIYNVDSKMDSSFTVVSKGKTLAETRETRQIKIDKKFLLGFEKVYVISEGMAEHGIKEILDVLTHTAQVNDTALVCVCKGKAEDIMKLKIEGYPSSGDFIEGLIRTSQEYNFYPKNYKLIDLALRVGAEGRNTVLPYIEIKDGRITMPGLAIFKNQKMLTTIGLQETKLLNLLKENKVTGMFTIHDEGEKYVNFYGKSKRKVECKKVENNYKFIINLTITGDITGNEEYEDMIDKPKFQKIVEDRLSKEVKADCEKYVQKIKSDYKVDCLDLGRIAVAKYGRYTGTDWDKIVTSSSIEVNVKVKIDKVGRADV